MNDYPLLNMFIQERVDDRCPSCLGHASGIMIVSSFDPRKTEEENVRALRKLYMDCEISKGPDLIYGDYFGVIVFHIRENTLPKMRLFCQQAVDDFHQPGYIECPENKSKPVKFVAADGTATVLPPWDGTVARLEEYISHLHAGFKLKGIWNREMTYVNMKRHQYGIA